VAAPSDAAASAPARDAEADARAIQSEVRAFAALLESRDAGRVARAYPGAAEWVGTWSDFLGTVRRLRVRLPGMEAPAVDGDEARIDFTARLEWDDAGGTGQHDSLPLAATLRRQGGGWVITALGRP
jgi:ketosteroid isomerase-like protein